MPKNGKEKSAAGAAGAAKKKKAPTEGDFIVFTNSTKEDKGTKGGSSSGAKPSGKTAETLPDGPPRPTVKQIIGGPSWTGKLPVNLLSEHCQREHWEKPVYDTRKFSEGFSVLVTLSQKNPKTQEVTTLPPFKLPPTHSQRVIRPTALEAKHAAATYALFRVSSMKNIHMTLPPDYRSLWKEFEELKKQDVKEDKAWMYAADPFSTLREREDAKVAAEKKKKEQQAAREKAANTPGGSGTLIPGNNRGGPGASNLSRGWNSVPKIDMGNRTRTQIEDLLRSQAIWNPHGVEMTKAQKAAIVNEFKGLGFRPSHIEEAVAECKDREESLEWLLVHVPEDDLPQWALPGRYNVGITLAASDLRREGVLKRLAETGYSAELCRKVYDANGADEGRAAGALQKLLVGWTAEDAERAKENSESWSSDDPEGTWSEELGSLEAVFGDQYTRPSPEVCQIRIPAVKNGKDLDVETFVQFRKGPLYPDQLIISILAPLPAYIKLSIVKKMLAYMQESLQGEDMKIFLLVDWAQNSINEIIENPGKLRDISAVASAASEETTTTARKTSRRKPRHPRPIDWTLDPRGKEAWLRRQESPALKEMIRQRQKLPAWQVKEEVVRVVDENQVTIISGETGSGKSTQSVQFILDDLYRRSLGHGANIIVTQPRRISALGLADRVSDERCSQIGQEVGYSIRGESKSGPNTKITFVTTGVLLRRLQTSGGNINDVVVALADVSHVVIDEVHERSLDTDFLLSILRDVLLKRKDLKLILMSATLDSATFKDYFVTDGLSVGLVEIAGRTYPVQDYYLDDIIRVTGFEVSGSVPGTSGLDPVAKTIMKLGSGINYNLIAETVMAIDADLSTAGSAKAGGILIFLPGVAEINQTCNVLRSIASLHVLPLHASLETREQKRVFAKPPLGKRKIVVATNVAETSITIDDIVAVIDSGRIKETSYDHQNNMRKLAETWASLAACKQRRGRAGRVQEGKCYKLFTRNLEEQMVPRPEPEIRRVPLEQLCLSVRAMGIKDVAGFLARAPTPPEATAVEGAVKMLQRMGALDGDELTALGQQLAMIPADLRCGKLMVFGAILGCLDECVTIAAILSSRSPFLSPQEKRDEAKEAKMRFSRGDGDLLTDLRAFQEWDDMMRDYVPQRQVRAFCDENFLSFNTLSNIASTRTQYYSALTEIGMVAPGDAPRDARSRPPASGSPPSMTLLRALTASAFTPQIVRIQFPDKKFMTSVSGAIELDPEAKTIKYFSQESGRVFVHPGSTLFGSQGFSANAAFLSYFTMVSTSKVFVRDLTPFNAYTLLMFSGSIDLDTMGRGLLVDGWWRLRGWARIGVLISRLRSMLDNLIALKVDNPAVDLRDNEVIKVVIKLIELDGMDA